jgi:uncharacterized protein involved in copper resistance
MKLKTTPIILASLISFAVAPVFAAPITQQEEMPIAGDSSKTKMGGMDHGGGKMGGMDHGDGGGKKKGCSMMDGKKDGMRGMDHGDGKKGGMGGMDHGDNKKGGMNHSDDKKKDKKAAKKKRQKMMDAKLNRINERLEVIETMLQQLLDRKK